MSTYRISQLAERTGVPATTLRYYDAAGLLPAERSPAGYRLYGEAAVERLGFVASGKRLGLPLDEIAEVLDVWETGACAQVKADLRPRLQARLADAERRRDEVDQSIGSLRNAVAHLDAMPDRSTRCEPNCGLLTLGAGDDRADAAVACSLTGDGATERAGQWRDVLAGATRQQATGGIRLTVPIDRLAAVAELAAAEQECCPFFDFQLHLDGPRLHLQVRAPAAAEPMLTDLFGSR